MPKTHLKSRLTKWCFFQLLVSSMLIVLIVHGILFSGVELIEDAYVKNRLPMLRNSLEEKLQIVSHPSAQGENRLEVVLDVFGNVLLNTEYAGGLALNQLVNHMKMEQLEIVESYIEIDNQIYLFSISPVSQKNPMRGEGAYDFVGSLIDTTFIEALMQKLYVNIDFTPIDYSLDTNESETNQNRDIKNTLILKDYANRPIAAMRSSLPKELYSILYRVINIAALTLIASTLLVYGIGLRFWYKNVLTRLVELKNDVIRTREGVDESLVLGRVIKHSDEIESLRNEINAMNETISTQKLHLEAESYRLQKANQSLELRIGERMRDISAINSLLAEKEQSYKAFVSQFPGLIFKLDRDLVFLSCEGKLQSDLIVKKEDLIGRRIEHVFGPEETFVFMENVKKSILLSEVVQFKYSFQIQEVEKFYEAKVVPRAHGQCFVFVTDITESHKMVSEVEYLSFHDQLTGLYNRRYLEINYERISTKRNLPITVFVLDVNGLKLINDGMGHPVGDEFLVAISAVMKASVDSESIIARIGGDEFVILISNEQVRTIEEIAQKISGDVKKITIKGISASISLGYYSTIEHVMALDEMINIADELMYQQKLVLSSDYREGLVYHMHENLLKLNNIEEVHSDFVSELSVKIGKIMGLDQDTLIVLYRAAQYHDIGKMSLSDDFWLNEGVLNSEDRKRVEQHSVVGYRILSSSVVHSELKEYVLHHHEHWDGSGYPKGYSAEEIPLLSRIIHVADAYEAMIHKRPYSTVKTPCEALKEIESLSGKQFDPSVVSSLKTCLEACLHLPVDADITES